MDSSDTTQWRGRSGVTLAWGISLSLIGLTVALGLLVWRTGTLDLPTATILTTALSTAVGALATYLGAQRTERHPNDDIGRHRPERAGNPETSRLDKLDGIGKDTDEW